MEFVFWYAIAGLIVCGISTLYNRIKYDGYELEFKPAGILISVTLWPLIVLALIYKLIYSLFNK